MEQSETVISELKSSLNYSLIEKGVDHAHLLRFLVGELEKLHSDKTSIISLIGGTASGKTTLAAELKAKLVKADSIGTDDYVIGDRQFRRANLEGGDPTRKYDSNFLNAKIRSICALKPGENVKVPTYNEESGLAIAEGEDNYLHSIGKVDFLIVEGDFDFVEKSDYLVYFHVPDEIRLDNRMNRDRLKRSEADMSKTKDNFVLRQRLQHIPYTLKAARKSDAMIIVNAKKADNGYFYSYDIYKKQ